MKRSLILPLVVAMVAAGCGGKSTHSTTGKTPSATSTPTSPSASGSGAPPDCNAAGINPAHMREGTCTHGGLTYVIVNQDSTLKLRTLWARLDGVHAAKSISNAGKTATAQGEFVIASVTITNKLTAPQTFDQANTQQAGLILEGALFKEAVSAEATGDPSACPARRTAIKTGQSETCDVIFDVPPSSAAALGKRGSGDLYLADFGSDLSGSILPKIIGQIRLYR